MSDYENDGFDDSIEKKPTKDVPAAKLQKASVKAQTVNLVIKGASELAASKNKAEPTASKKETAARSEQESSSYPHSWHDIVAANDTNKHIIHKFMKKGFSSLSAEELACTMVQPDFTLDFKKNTKEDWVAGYQFKVVARLSKCKFNLKWNTKSSVTTQGQGEIGTFFDLCKTGDIDRVVKFFRS